MARQSGTVIESRKPSGAGPSKVNGTSVIGPAPVLPRPRRRRRPVLAAVAVILAVVFALGAVWLSTSSSRTVAVIGLARDVAWGQSIAAADLVEVQAVPDPGLSPLPWGDAAGVVGRFAAVDLVAGGLLTAADLTDAVIPGAGQALVGVDAKPGQLPASGMRAGNRVLLVIAGDPASPGSPTPDPVPGTVFTVGGTDQSGGRTVDVLVARDLAAPVALAGAAGRISLVVVARG